MRRWAGAAGLAFVVLAIASAAAQGDVPNTDAANATEEFARFYGDETITAGPCSRPCWE